MLIRQENYGGGNRAADFDGTCLRCGFHVYCNYNGHDDFLNYYLSGKAVLLRLDINSTQVTFEELGAFLRKQKSAIFDLSPRRFEQLVADCYKNIGWEVSLTRQTKDGGYDLMLLQNGKSHCIVECKRHTKTLGVQLVRELAGVCLDLNLKRAKLVGTAAISADAKRLACRMGSKGYDFELVDAEALFGILEIYNTELPPINGLTERELREIQKRTESGQTVKSIYY